jgi:hypothetical protein
VSSFDNADPGEWAQDTAQLSGLDEDDVLLAVASGSATYEYGYWVDDDVPALRGGPRARGDRRGRPRLAAATGPAR